jgi:hypothetical protein
LRPSSKAPASSNSTATECPESIPTVDPTVAVVPSESVETTEAVGASAEEWNTSPHPYGN